MENSLSMPELIAVLNAKQEEDYENRKFFAALKGIDIDQDEKRGQDEWERIKAKALSKGSTKDPNDIVALQGYAATQAGFGIGIGLDYEVI
jgi:hypothetical protein